MIKTIASKFILFSCIAMLCGCGDKQSAKSGGQIIANVNGEEISIHQLNYVLGHTDGIKQENLDAVKKQIINAMVDQSLWYQKAMADKLDREPAVMMALEQARRQILAKASLEKTSAVPTKPSSIDIDKYYQEHPDLFARHKIFKMKEVQISLDQARKNSILQLLNSSNQLDDILKQLDVEKFTYKTRLIEQAAENLPLDQLPNISALKSGEFIRFSGEKAVSLLSVISSQEDSIDKVKAQPIIEAFLINQQRKDILEKASKTMRDQAKVEYMGEFSSLNVPVSSGQPKIEIAKPELVPKEDSISRGLKGL